MTEILDKTKEWSERFGHILRASAETQFSHLYKGVVGGLEHVISVDNGGSYMEMWRDGGDQYYATTGAAIKPLPGLAKGARLDEALDRFFVLMAKVEKDAGARPEHGRGQRPQRKAIPKKIKRLAGVRKNGLESDNPPRPEDFPHGRWGVRKNIVEKVDPEIGPSMSVGHRKPSDLSPESSMRKLAKRIIADINRLNKTSAADFVRYAPHGPDKPHTPPSSSCPNCPKKPPVRKNVVALTGNQPGSGRVKPSRSRKLEAHDTPQSPHKEHTRGGRAQPEGHKEQYAKRHYNQVAGILREAGRQLHIARERGEDIDPMQAMRQLTAKFSEAFHADNPRFKPEKFHHAATGTGGQYRDIARRGRKQDSAMEGGRVRDPTKPAKPRVPPKTYHSKEGFSGRRMGKPGQGVHSGAARSSGRFGKACVCDEVAKAVRAVEDKGYPMGSLRSMPKTYRVTGPSGKPGKPIKLPKGAS